MTLLLAVAAGVLIGLSLGALGGGGSILAVPVLVYALGQSPAQATTGSLVVVAVTSLVGAVAAHRAGNVLLARGVVFGLVATGGAVAGARASAAVAEPVLLGAFAVLMLAVGTLLAVRLWRGRHPLEGVPGEMGVTLGAELISRRKRAYLSAVIAPSVRRATVVAVPSDFVRDSVVRAYGVDEERVMVVPHGIEPGLASDASLTRCRRMGRPHARGDRCPRRNPGPD